MLQLKMWGFDLRKPKGYTPKKMEKEINNFLSIHNCVQDSFEMFQLEDFLIVKILYKIRKSAS